MKLDLMLWICCLFFNDWDFADYKPMPLNEMELYETHYPEMLKLFCTDSSPRQFDRFAKQTTIQPQIPPKHWRRHGSDKNPFPVPGECPTGCIPALELEGANSGHFRDLDPQSVASPTYNTDVWMTRLKG